MGASKAKLWLKCYFIYVQMGRLEEPPRTFYLGGYIIPYLPHQIDKREQNCWDYHCEETKRGHIENAEKIQLATSGTF